MAVQPRRPRGPTAPREPLTAWLYMSQAQQSSALNFSSLAEATRDKYHTLSCRIATYCHGCGGRDRIVNA
jgi:hypothetical protein